MPLWLDEINEKSGSCLQELKMPAKRAMKIVDTIVFDFIGNTKNKTGKQQVINIKEVDFNSTSFTLL